MEQKQSLKEKDYFKKLLFLSQQKSKNLISKDINDLLPIIKEEEELIEKIRALKEDRKDLSFIILELKNINQKNKELVVRSLFFLEECLKFLVSFEDKCIYGDRHYGNRHQDKSILFNQVM